MKRQRQRRQRLWLDDGNDKQKKLEGLAFLGVFSYACLRVVCSHYVKQLPLKDNWFITYLMLDGLTQCPFHLSRRQKKVGQVKKGGKNFG